MHRTLKTALRRVIPGWAIRVIRAGLASLHCLLRYPKFFRQFRQFRTLAAGGPVRFSPRLRDLFPCLGEDTRTTGFDRHYIYHPAWAARVLRQTLPREHVDISSTLHFCSLVSAFLPVRFYDYRPAPLQLSGLRCGRADLTGLPFPDHSIESLSCMHTVEHVGLGRYGDPLDPDGDRKAMRELERVLAYGGDLLFVVPVGRPRLLFNAHRIYSYDQVIAGFPQLELKQFALVPDAGGERDFVDHATPALAALQSFACGCFWFRKAARPCA